MAAGGADALRVTSRESRVASGLVAGAALLALVGCRVTPLSNRIAVGEEPFVIFVGDGPGGATDLFASPASGGEVVQLTFSRERESSPALDPTGSILAFLRRPVPGKERTYLVVMNLQSGAERETRVPTALGQPSRVAWTGDGEHLLVGADRGILETAAPPDPLDLAPLPASGAVRDEAESALAVLLGEPAFARVVPCTMGQRSGICVEGHAGVQTLVEEGHDPVRWGPDSLGYLRDGVLWVRPLGAGRPRRFHWSRAPANPREPTYFTP